jgi:hypothetical protein
LPGRYGDPNLFVDGSQLDIAGFQLQRRGLGSIVKFAERSLHFVFVDGDLFEKTGGGVRGAHVLRQPCLDPIQQYRRQTVAGNASLPFSERFESMAAESVADSFDAIG